MMGDPTVKTNPIMQDDMKACMETFLENELFYCSRFCQQSVTGTQPSILKSESNGTRPRLMQAQSSHDLSSLKIREEEASEPS